MTTDRHGPWAALVVTAALLLSACSNSAATTPGAVGVADEAPLPTDYVHGDELTSSLAEILQFGDNAVRAKLIGIEDGYRILIGPEDKENSEERLGLVFQVEESYLGGAAPGDEIKMDGPGYRIDGTTKTRERTAKISANGVSVDTWSVGEDYLFFYASTSVGLRFRSFRLMLHVSRDGNVTPMSDMGMLPEFADARTATELVRRIDRAAKLTPAG